MEYVWGLLTIICMGLSVMIASSLIKSQRERRQQPVGEGEFIYSPGDNYYPKPPAGIEINPSHPLARGLVTYDLKLKDEELRAQPIFCYDRQLSDEEVQVLHRTPYAMFNSPRPLTYGTRRSPPIASIGCMNTDEDLIDMVNEIRAQHGRPLLEKEETKPLKEKDPLLGRKLRLKQDV